MAAFRALDVTEVARSCDRLVVRTPRCGRGNPGSNPGRSTFYVCNHE